MSLRLFTRILQLQPGVKNYSFKSSIALDKLYPQSSLSITKVPPPPQNEPTKFSGYIPMDKIQLSYSRSSGPGGQNVDKVNTKANLRFNVHEANWIPEVIRNNVMQKFKNHVSKNGFISIQSDRTRYQHLNTADVLQKLREMIRSCEPIEVKELSPETTEKLRRRREKAARERLLEKRARASVKSSRGAV